MSIDKNVRKALRSIMHPSTESPGKKFVYIFFKVRGHKCLLCELVRFWSPGVVPAEVAFKMEDGTQKLAVGWIYAEDLASLITKKMVMMAKFDAWAWYKEDEA